MNNIEFEVTPDLLASKGKRFINLIIDLLPQYAFIYSLAYVLYYLGDLTGNYEIYDYYYAMSTLEDYALNYSFLIIYFFFFENYKHRTLGKYITNTKVVTIKGEEPSAKTIFIRSLCRLIPFDTLSFLGQEGKGWHDSISNSYVVDIEKFEAKRTTQSELDLIGIDDV